MPAAAPIVGEPVAPENSDLIARIYEHFNRDGLPPAGTMTDDVEWHPLRSDPDFEVHRGVEAVESYLNRWTGSFEDFEATILDSVFEGDVARLWVCMSGRVKGGESRVSMEQAIVYAFRDGRVSAGWEFENRDEAENLMKELSA